MTSPEVWLRGPLPDYIEELQPVAHSLLQVREEVGRFSALPPDKLWAKPGGAASIGFHLKHLAGSLDRLLQCLHVTLAAVSGDSLHITRQSSGLIALQTYLADRNRTDSLQLLRIQNDLNSLGLAMRDMLDTSEPYPLSAWSSQFARIRGD